MEEELEELQASVDRAAEQVERARACLARLDAFIQIAQAGRFGRVVAAHPYRGKDEASSTAEVSMFGRIWEAGGSAEQIELAARRGAEAGGVAADLLRKAASFEA